MTLFGSFEVSDKDLCAVAVATTTTEWDRFWNAYGVVVRRVALTRSGLREAQLSTLERPVPAAPAPVVAAAPEPVADASASEPSAEAEAQIDPRRVPHPCPECGEMYKPAGLSVHRRHAHGWSTEQAILSATAVTSAPVEAPTRVDFAARAKAAAASTWTERTDTGA